MLGLTVRNTHAILVAMNTQPFFAKLSERWHTLGGRILILVIANILCWTVFTALPLAAISPVFVALMVLVDLFSAVSVIAIVGQPEAW